MSLNALNQLPALKLSQALVKASQAGFQGSPAWQAGLLECTRQQLAGLSEDQMPCVAALVWAVSELGCTPKQPWLQAAASKMLQGIRAGSFLAPDLCQLVAALGAMGYTPEQEEAAELLKEVQLQVS
jgi:hypothetical protein